MWRRSALADELVPIFRVEAAREVAAWHARLGFEVLGEHQFEPGLPLYVFLRRNGVQLHLSEHLGDAPPRSLAYFYVGDAGELDEIATEFGVSVCTQPWGREVQLADPCGNRLRIAAVPSS